MYEPYTRQALPEKAYRELLGSALCVFNSNNTFIIENILRVDISGKSNWYSLIDLESGRLKENVKKSISSQFGNDIENQFSKLVEMRNRIIHSYQVTENDRQILATKEKSSSRQFIITEEYLIDFIKQNEKLSSMLHNLRGY